MKKSKKVLLSAAIAAAIMGSVSLPQIQAAEIGSGVTLKATTTPNPWQVGGGYDVKTTDKYLDATLATNDDLKKVNNELNTKANVADIAQKVKTKEVVADNVKATNVNASNLSVSGKAEFTGTDGVSISDSLTVGNDTFNVDAESGITSAKNLHGDQLTAGNATFDTTDANTTKTGTLTVTGDTRLEGTTLAKEIGAGKVVSDEIEAGKTTTDSLTVTGNTRLEGTTLAKEIGAGKVVSDEIEAGKLTVGNIDNVEQAITDNKAAADKAQKTADANTNSINALDGRVTTNESNIAKNTTAITKETSERVAAYDALSTRITDNSTAIQSLRHDVSDLGTEIDNVGAISAALAGLHPLDWNGSGSKFQLSAAAGTYDGKQAMALGGFYHPNRNMMLSLGVSSSFGSDRKTAGNVGITFRVGKGSNGTVSDDVAERLAAMDQKISQLESQNQKLTSMLAIVDPSLTKEFPDVPANHWAYEAVSKLAGNGIVEGYPDGDFHGDRTMTRYEMAQVIYKALKKGGTVDQKLVKEFNKEIEAAKANDAQ